MTTTVDPAFYRDLTTRNPTQTLTWEFQLAPNDEKKFHFDYTTITTR